MNDCADEATECVWDHTTNVRGLVRHRKSGRYYARFKLHGRRTMKALKTSVCSVAKSRLADELAKAGKLRAKARWVVESGDVRSEPRKLDRGERLNPKEVQDVEETSFIHRRV